jgi:DNA-binding NtrC family response regulator
MIGKILVAADDYVTRNSVSLFLNREGYDVVTADNGTEAARRLSVESFDLVLADFEMPGMDGLSLSRHINRVAPYTAIIIMSGSADVNPEDILATSASDFIEKPIILNRLLAKIERAFATGIPHQKIGFSIEGHHFIG